MKQEKINVACPHCGHVQLEPRDGYSTVCKKCHQHFRLEEVLHPQAGPAERAPDKRQVKCFECGTLLDVATQAESTMCKRCSTHIDLRNYHINQAVSKNFRTYGSFEVGEKGYVFNTEAEVGDAIIRGKFLGKLHAHRTLILYAPEQFKGTFKAARLIVPAGTHLVWSKSLDVESVEVSGELVANVQVPGCVELKATSLLFGDVEAANLVVNDGAVLVGNMKIGSPGAAHKTSPGNESTSPSPEASPAEAHDLPGLTVDSQRKASARKKKQP
jgi:cytoskeletal protein CcmA (bactofilin family)/DNA-directed RNA polymerase subunit RPC12/RpoP